MKHIPNLFTLLNLVFGCMAIVACLQNGITIQYNAEGGQFIDISEKLWLASIFIGIAAVIDFLDGFVARLFNATSELGKQLDSLADVVSFGAAPSMIIYQFLRMGFAQEENGIEAGWLALMPAFLIAMAAAYRLGRFNLDAEQQFGFKGLPVPAAGLLIASLPLIYWNSQNATLISLLLNKWFLYALILVVSWLMISKLPLLAFKFKEKTIAANLPLLILFILGLAGAFTIEWLTIPVVFLAYIILSLLFKTTKS